MLLTSARVLRRAMRPGQPLMAPSSGGATLLVKKMWADPYVGLPDQSCDNKDIDMVNHLNACLKT